MVITLTLNDDNIVTGAYGAGVSAPDGARTAIVDESAWAPVAGAPGVMYDGERLVVPDAAITARDATRIKAQISELEALRQPRAMREALLTGDQARLRALDEEIATLRNKLT